MFRSLSKAKHIIRLLLFQISITTQAQQITAKKIPANNNHFTKGIFSNTGAFIASSYYGSGNVSVFETFTGKQILRIKPQDEAYGPRKIFFDQKDNHLILVYNRNFKIFNRRTGKEISTVHFSNEAYPKVNFNPKSNLLSCVLRDSIKVFKLIDSTATLISAIKAKNFITADSSEDGKYIVALDSASLNIWKDNLESTPIKVPVTANVISFSILKDSILLLINDKFSYSYISYDGRQSPVKAFKNAYKTLAPAVTSMYNNNFAILSYKSLVIVSINGNEFSLKLGANFDNINYSPTLNLYLVSNHEMIRVIDENAAVRLEISSQTAKPTSLSFNLEQEKAINFTDSSAFFSNKSNTNQKNLNGLFSGIDYKYGDWSTVALYNGEVEVWNTKEEKKIYNIRHTHFPSIVTTDEKTKTLFLFDYSDNGIYKYDLVSKKGMLLKKESLPVTALLFHEGNLLIGMASGEIKSLDATLGKIKYQVNKFTNPISLIIRNGNKMLASSFGRILNMESNFSDSTSAPVLIGHNGLITSMSMHKSGKYFASAAYDNTIKLWDLEKNRLFRSYNLDTINVSKVELGLNFDMLGIGPISYVSISDSLEIAKLNNSPLALIVQTPNNNQASKIIISKDGKLLAATDKNTVKIRDLKSGFLIKELKTQNNVVNGIAFSDDSKMLAVATGTGIECFEPYSGIQLRYIDFEAAGYSIHDVEFVNNFIVGINIHGWHLPKLFHKNSGLEVGSFNYNQSKNEDKLIIDLKFSPDGKRIVTYGDNFIKLFDAANFREIIALPRRSKKAFVFSTMDLVDFSPDNKYFLYSEPGESDQIRIVDAITGTIIKSHNGDLAKFGNNGKYLYALSKWLTIANILNDKEVKLSTKANVYVNVIAFNSLENVFAIADSFGSIKFLEGTNGKLVKDINRFDQYTYHSIQSSDKRFLMFNNQFGLFTFDFKTLTRAKINGDNYPFNGAFSNNSEIVYYKRDSSIYQANPNGEKEKKIIDLPDQIKEISSVLLSEDGKLFSFTNENGKIHYYYEIQSGKQLYKLNKSSVADYTLAQVEGTIVYKEGKYQAKINGMKNIPGGLKITPVLLNLDNSQITPLGPEVQFSDKDWKYRDIGRSMAEFHLAVFSVSPSGKYFSNIDQGKGRLIVTNLKTRDTIFKRDHLLSDRIKKLIFDPAEKYFIIAFENGNIETYDLLKPTPELPKNENYVGLSRINSINGSDHGINNISLTNDLLLVTGTNAMLSIFDMKKNAERLISMVFIRDRDQVLIDNDGYYYATKGATKYLAFKKGDEIYAFDQFDQVRNRPDKIMEILFGQGLTSPELLSAYKNAYLKRAQISGTKSEQTTDLPQLSVNSSAIKQVSYEAQIALPILASSKTNNLSKLHILINGVSYYGVNGNSIQGKTLQKTIPITLSSGENVIKVFVEDAKKLQSYPVTLNVNFTPSQVVKPDLYIIAMSVSDYAEDKDLKYARKDGRDIIAKFKTNPKFGNVYIDTLFDKMATKENFLALKQKLLKSKPDDNVILFLSGHGLLDKKYEFYFATYDCVFSDPAKKGIAYASLEGLLDSIPARKKLLLLDACHSGEFDKNSTEEVAPLAAGVKSTTNNESAKGVVVTNTSLGLKNSYVLMQDLFANLNMASGSVVISAAAGDSYALESDAWRNGIFTYSILSGISDLSADLDDNKSITISELREYVYKKVSFETGGRQKPTTRQENLEFDWAVW